MSRPAWIFGLIVIAVLIAGLYRAKFGARDAAGEIAAIEAEIKDAEQRKALLEAEVSHLARREWIEEYARKELGMAPPSAEQFITPDDLDARLVSRENSGAPGSARP
ncbi:MAG: cell division protein FtsL [Pseudomonadota bacterium]